MFFTADHPDFIPGQWKLILEDVVYLWEFSEDYDANFGRGEVDMKEVIEG